MNNKFVYCLIGLTFLQFGFITGLGQSQKKSNLIKLDDYDDINEAYLDLFVITSFFSANKLSCMSSCTNKENCIYALFKAKRCFICNVNAGNYLTKSNQNGIVYRKLAASCQTNQYFDSVLGCVSKKNFMANCSDDNQCDNSNGFSCDRSSKTCQCISPNFFSNSSLKCESCQSGFTCLFGWTVLGSGGSCFCYLQPSMSLTRSISTASQYCLNLGSRLMVINSQTEFTALKAWFNTLIAKGVDFNRIWIGCTTNLPYPRNNFVWNDGTAQFTNSSWWYPGEPNNAAGNDLGNCAECCCAYFPPNPGMYDFPCAHNYPFICEWTNNQTAVTCPSNLYYANVLGCVNKQYYNQPCSANEQCNSAFGLLCDLTSLTCQCNSSQYFSYSSSTCQNIACQTNFLCPSGFSVALVSNGYCLCLSAPSLSMSYSAASQYCLNKGARIMVLKNQTDINAFNTWFSLFAGTTIWLGATTNYPYPKDNWVWSDGSPLFRNSSLWLNSQPDNQHSHDFSLGASCAVYYSPNSFDDLIYPVTSGNWPFVCEYTNNQTFTCPSNLYHDSILGCIRKQTYGQACSISDQCDADVGLFCNQSLTCQCDSSGSQYYSYSSSRCQTYQSNLPCPSGWHLQTSFSYACVACMDPSMINWWPLQVELKDCVSGSTSLISSNSYNSVSFVSITSDHLNNFNAAVSLTMGYFKLPSNVYFYSSDFTFAIWAEFSSLSNGTRILDCGLGPGNNSIVLKYSSGSLEFDIFVGSTQYSISQAHMLGVGVWNHFAITLQGTLGTIYLNGNTLVQGALAKPSAVTRSRCFVGKSNYASDPQYVSASFSDMRVYSRALSRVDILNLIYPSSSLINFWPLTGDLNDLISATSMTSSGIVSYTADHSNTANSAVSLSGGYLQLPANVYFSGDFTFAIWANLYQLQSHMRILDCASGINSNDGLVLTYISSPLIEFQLFNGATNNWINYAQSIATGVWNHYAITLQGTLVTIYFNGNMLAQKTSAIPSSVNRTNCFVGRSTWTWDPQNVDAAFSDMRIYSRDLGQVEILNLIDSSLINFWPLKSNLNDAISGLSLISSGSISYTTDHLGNANSAVSLSSTYLQLPANVYFSGDFTFAIWANFNSLSTSTRIIDCGLGESSDNIVLTYLDGPNRFEFDIFVGTTGHYINNPMTLGTGIWNHYAITLQGTTGTIYVNGNLLVQGTFAVPNAVIRSGCFIGKSNWASDPQSVIASFSDMRIYSRALSQREILNVMDPSLINFWPLKGNLNDAISGLSLSSSGSVSYTTDHSNNTNSAVSLSPDYLQLPADVYFQGDFTFTIWANFNSISLWSRIIDCGSYSTTGQNDNIILSFYIPQSISPPDYDLRYYVFTGTTGYDINLVQSISTGIWNHYAITLQGTTGKIYFNGTVLVQGTMAAPLSVVRTNCLIGKSNTQNGDPLTIDAALSDMRIYNRALSQVEIQALTQ